MGTPSKPNEPVVTCKQQAISVSLFQEATENGSTPEYRTVIQNNRSEESEPISFCTSELPILQGLIAETFQHILDLEEENRKSRA